jgi:AraC family transcriptional regulator
MPYLGAGCRLAFLSEATRAKQERTSFLQKRSKKPLPVVGRGLATLALNEQKLFWFSFSKKNCLLAGAQNALCARALARAPCNHRAGVRRLYETLTDYYEDIHAATIVEKRQPPGAGRMLATTQMPGDWSDAPTPELGIGFVTSGTGRYQADLGAGRFQSQTRRYECILMAPDAGTTIERDAPHAVMFHVLPYARLQALAGDALPLPPHGDFGRLHAGPLPDPRIARLLEQIWHSAEQPGAAAALFNQSALLMITALLIQARDRAPRQPGAGGLAPWQLNRVIHLMNARLDAGLTLEDLAAEARLSPCHFARGFKASTGVSPHRYHINLRMQRVREWLETTDLPVSEIAARAGYSDPSYLARLFRAELGTTPARYRRQKS